MPRSVSGAPHPQVHYFSERLRARLDQIPEFRTTFVEAQSGAGKTTALQDFFGAPEMAGASVRWFVAGEEPHTSGWMRLCRVLNDIDPEAGAHLLRLGFPVEENQGEIAQALMELRCDAETYLVCDNFQFVQKNLPASVWKALIEHGGDGLRLVILTRQLSSRGLTVLGNADVLRIDNDDFCLTAGEIGAYYRMAGVELDEDEMRSLHRYSEGWIVALYLQLMSFFRTGSLERKASVYELMNELLWKGLSREDRLVLFRLSPFDAFSVPQAAFLLGVESLPEALTERLNHRMFIRYDITIRRYFPHAILLDFVRSALSDEPEALRREILRRAGEWCAATGEKTRALDFFYRLKDYPAILSLGLRSIDLSRVVLDTSRDAMLALLRDIADNVAPELRRDHAFTLITIAFQAFALGDRNLHARLCGEMRELLEGCEMDEPQRRALLGELCLAASFGAYNDIAKMGEGHRRAYELLGPNSTLFEPDSPWTFGWPSVLAMFHSGVGRMDAELEQMDENIPRYSALTSGNGGGAELVFRAEALFHRGLDAEAEALALKALAVTRQYGQDSIYICTVFLLRRIALLRADAAAFDQGASLIRDCLRRSRYFSRCRNIADMAAGFLAILLNDPDGVPEWLCDDELRSGRILSPALPFAQTIQGRLLLLTGRGRDLLLRSEEFLSTARRYRSLLSEVYTLMCLAVAQQHLGREAEGLDTLCGALDLALPDGLILPFAENADLLGATLGQALNRSWKSARREVLALKERYAQGKEALLRSRAGDAVPADLTPREFEVARMAAGGASNREIAQALYLSDNTVKFYMKAVFQKLDVRSRRDLKDALRKPCA